ncbi:MAG: hypothetical protein ACM3ME_03920 [Chloroflexota bacterium]
MRRSLIGILSGILLLTTNYIEFHMGLSRDSFEYTILQHYF